MSRTPEQKYKCPCGVEVHLGPFKRHLERCWTPRTLERLLELCGVKSTPENGCWIATKNLKEGYPRVMMSGKRVKASRALFSLVNGGEMPPSWLVMMHTCDNPPCMKPAHIKPGTQGMNVEDMLMKGRGANGTGKHGPECVKYFGWAVERSSEQS